MDWRKIILPIGVLSFALLNNFWCVFYGGLDFINCLFTDFHHSKSILRYSTEVLSALTLIGLFLSTKSYTRYTITLFIAYTLLVFTPAIYDQYYDFNFYGLRFDFWNIPNGLYVFSLGIYLYKIIKMRSHRASDE